MLDRKYTIPVQLWRIGLIVLIVGFVIIGGIKIKGYYDARVLCERIKSGNSIESTTLSDALTAPVWVDELAKICQVDGPKIALVEACYYRNVSAVATLLKNGADPNFFIEGRRSPLEAAISNGPAGPIDEISYTIVEMLVAAGADVNKHAMNDPVVIQLSSSMVLDANNPVKEKILCFLLDNNAVRAHRGYDYVLHNIVCSGNVALTEKLIEAYGADVNGVDNDSQTPLILAVSYSEKTAQTEMIQMLLQHGANTTYKDASGKSALDWAVELGKKEIIDLLS